MRTPLVWMISMMMSTALLGQYQINLIPRKSPDKGIYHKIGFTEMEIAYGSPKVNNRKIWGDLVPYNELWRAGANVATTIQTSHDIEINGKILPKGRYAFFVIPSKEKKWEVIFSNKPDQWGAFGHQKSEEMLRAAFPVNSSYFTEELMYRIHQVDFENGEILLDWEEIRLSIPFKTNYLDRLEEELNAQLLKTEEPYKWILYLQAGEYLYNQKKRINKALAWINESERLSQNEGTWNPKYYPKEYILGHLYWTKAKILGFMADYDTALSYAQLMKNQKGKYIFYDEENEFENIDAQIKKWEIKAN